MVKQREGEIRLLWKLTAGAHTTCGNGRWFPDTSENRNMLNAHCAENRLPNERRWIEARPTNPARCD